MKDVDAIRFWGRVDRSGDCWEWRATRLKNRYGSVKLHGKMYKAHRVAWFLVNGDIPAGLHICHRCDNPSCVRPEHLFAGTARDNMRDKVAKGRHVSQYGDEHAQAHNDYTNLPRGSRHWTTTNPSRVSRGEHRFNAKLTWDKVAEIRRRSRCGEMNITLASEYGVTEMVISRVVRGLSWVLPENTQLQRLDN